MKKVVFIFLVLVVGFLSAQTMKLSPISNDPVNQLRTNSYFQVEDLNYSFKSSIKIRSWQSNLEDALYLLNGEPISKEELNTINPDVIESITVYKGEKAVELFGERGRKGVLDIKTKDKNYKIPQPEIKSLPELKQSIN